MKAVGNADIDEISDTWWATWDTATNSLDDAIDTGVGWMDVLGTGVMSTKPTTITWGELSYD